jgi:hypothetical protein
MRRARCELNELTIEGHGAPRQLRKGDVVDLDEPLGSGTFADALGDYIVKFTPLDEAPELPAVSEEQEL